MAGATAARTRTPCARARPGVLAGRRVGMAPADTGVAVFEERLRQAVTRVPSLPDLAARLTRAVTVAIDRSKTADAGGHGLALVVGFSAAFLLLGVEVAPYDVQRPDFAVASIVLLVGAATAVGCSHLVAILRSSLAERQRELSELSTRLMSVQEEERRRLARELHDEFGQTLTAVNANLWLIERQAPADAEALRHRAAETRRLVGRTLAAMRELSQLLRPAVLDTLGLVPSLETLLDAFGEHHQLAITLTSDGLPERLPAEMETALYRITQEALTNAARHARAARVRVALTAIGGELRLEIEDDGVGFAAGDGAKSPTGTGLVGIRERVRALGG